MLPTPGGPLPPEADGGEVGRWDGAVGNLALRGRHAVGFCPAVKGTPPIVQDFIPLPLGQLGPGIRRVRSVVGCSAVGGAHLQEVVLLGTLAKVHLFNPLLKAALTCRVP